jgi:ABC-2 type transport system permease protein
MSTFRSAFWAEGLKARRSKVAWGITIGFMILPLAGGLFMIILKNPDQARAMGLITMKAQLAGGVADWPTFFQILLQGAAIGGAMVFAFITAWVFGREFSDHTVKELLAVPTQRWTIVAAKFALTAIWIMALTLLIFIVGLGIGAAVNIPGWSTGLAWVSFWSLLSASFLNLMLMSFVAFFASMGRGYLPPLGWAIVTVFFAQIAAILGWGDWFPWAVPALASGMAGPPSEMLGPHSYILVVITFLAALGATFAWWQSADQTR